MILSFNIIKKIYSKLKLIWFIIKNIIKIKIIINFLK